MLNAGYRKLRSNTNTHYAVSSRANTKLKLRVRERLFRPGLVELTKVKSTKQLHRAFEQLFIVTRTTWKTAQLKRDCVRIERKGKTNLVYLTSYKFTNHGDFPDTIQSRCGVAQHIS